ncbi:hypothetical protein ID866_12957 [Astraeus odoratus]|nr:hypothetical protein ID866_12957 [Astraeus odoratus]
MQARRFAMCTSTTSKADPLPSNATVKVFLETMDGQSDFRMGRHCRS